MVVFKLIFLSIFLFALVQNKVPSIHKWLENHQDILTLLNIICIVTYIISLIDILM